MRPKHQGGHDNSFIAVLVRISATLCDRSLTHGQNCKEKKISTFNTQSYLVTYQAHMWLQPEYVKLKLKKPPPLYEYEIWRSGGFI